MRIIYHWDAPSETIYMLLAYKKAAREELTKEQLKTLAQLVKEWLR